MSVRFARGGSGLFERGTEGWVVEEEGGLDVGRDSVYLVVMRVYGDGGLACTLKRGDIQREMEGRAM